MAKQQLANQCRSEANHGDAAIQPFHPRQQCRIPWTSRCQTLSKCFEGLVAIAVVRHVLLDEITRP